MTDPEAGTREDAVEPISAVASVVAAAGVRGRALRAVIALLTERSRRLDDLVRECAVPRRSVEALLRAAGSDLGGTASEGVMLNDAVVPSYRERFGYDQLRRTAPADPFHAPLAAQRALTERLAGLIAAAPAANEALDHVSATAETATRRAMWLDATYDLAGAHLVCVGDHDLTSLAVSAISPECRVSVVDIDERLLDYIAAQAAEAGAAVECWYADLRFGLPPVLAGSADLVFTDPPYTPEGVSLFLGRGAQALRDRSNGRLVMAYGFSPLSPALGVKVQRAVHDLDLAVEAILPGFNRYDGAQAVGSASDLYVCQPTSRTWQVLDKRLARAVVNIYTHGGQSLEGQTADLPESVIEAVLAAVGDGTEPTLFVGDGWPQAAQRGQRLTLPDLLSGAPPAPAPRNQRTAAVVNLADDPGPWLLRTLLAVNADRMAILLPNQHADLGSASGQSTLRALVESKYTLRLRRSTPTPRHAIVEATATTGDGAVRWLLTHAHGKVGNVLREGLVRDSARDGQPPMTKNEARAKARQLVAHQAWLDARLLDLPRGAVQSLLLALTTETKP
ncbi:bis-aminopropyl spermidine synthase family protein [Actinoallomurus vinaceus]